MPHSVTLITLALIMGFIAVRLKLPALVGYLFAGIIIGPATPGFVADAAISSQLAEIGVMLLMFGVGLHFSLDDLLTVRHIALPGAVAQMLVATLLATSIAAFVIVLLFRYPLTSAVTVSASLAQIGEFSFILANQGVSLGLLPPVGQSLLLAGAILSIALNPLLFRAIEPVQAWVRSRSKIARQLDHPEDPLAMLPMTIDLKRLTGHIVLVGYGRVGRRVGEALAQRGISFVVAEENREIVEKLRDSGIPAVVGNAAEADVLIQAHAQRARMLVIAIPDTVNVRQMVEISRMLNPPIHIVVRTHSEQEAALLERENVGKVFLGEHELALGMTRYVLERFGLATSSDALR